MLGAGRTGHEGAGNGDDDDDDDEDPNHEKGPCESYSPPRSRQGAMAQADARSLKAALLWMIWGDDPDLLALDQ
ncbi:hypothetical protein WISP_135272 [Willisornis vidua]|uniref:Uncharacterized protein n=1 Tax=Willisornis vidua TaxID=1566151 RepID=A0ABQ9CTD7_9PASS|nr:hypothetical protein WISP_135272 [Willisornis vidua]